MNTCHTGRLDEEVKSAASNSFKGCRLFILACQDNDVVTAQSAKSLITPQIKVFYSTKSHMRVMPEVLDLSKSGITDKIAGREDPAKWHFPDLDEMWSGLPQLNR